MAKYIFLPCPNCEQEIKVRVESLGKKVRCPKCQAAVTVVPPVREPTEATEPIQPTFEPEPAPNESPRFDMPLPSRHDPLDDSDSDVAVISEPAPLPAAMPVKVASSDKVGCGSAIRIITWVLCVAWSAFCVAHYVGTQSRATSAIQEAAMAADTAVWLIAGYVVCRAIDSLTRG